MGELKIRDMDQGEEFAEWFSELVLQYDEEAGTEEHYDDRFLVLTDEIGDWLGGAKYYLRGGVAHLQELAVRPDAQHCGHAHRLLAAFEARATEAGAHLCEFWTDDLESSALLGALGWQTVMRREHYVGDRTWVLLERRLDEEA